ncbi:uridine kinase [Cellulomonas sp. NPDC055163]
MTAAAVPGADRPGVDAAGAAAGGPGTVRSGDDLLPAVVGSVDRVPAAANPAARASEGGSPSSEPPAAVAHVAGLTLDRAARLGPVRLVCVDGPAGSGKSTFAGALVGHLTGRGVHAAALHLDDLYAGWSGLDGDLAPRLSAQVLEPLRRGRSGRHQRYDWVRGEFADWVDVPVPRVLVVEGCGSGRRRIADDAVVLVWVEAPAGLRLDRGLERDGEAMRPQWERWMRDEQSHFARERTAGRADVRLDAYGRMVG